MMENLQVDNFTFKTIIEASPFPVYLCKGEEMVVTIANAATLKAWGKTEDVIGKPFREALPELENQPFQQLLLDVYHTGITRSFTDQQANIIVDGQLQTFYFEFSYQPFKGPDGKITGVFCFANDVTDRKLAEMRKNDFITIASHELKTPLTTIKSYVQLLLAKAITDQDTFRIDALSRVEKQANKMSILIQNFLNNAKLVEGKFNIVTEHFSTHELLLEVVNDARILSPTHVLVMKDCEDVLVIADRDKIAQVLENLVSNAVKYSPVGSIVTISCKTCGGQAQIAVTDMGVGIDKKDQARLFDRFYRVENDKLKNVAGFGIGLYLVAEILRLHNSKIFVESRANAGSRFYFDLPVA